MNQINKKRRIDHDQNNHWLDEQRTPVRDTFNNLMEKYICIPLVIEE